MVSSADVVRWTRVRITAVPLSVFIDAHCYSLSHASGQFTSRHSEKLSNLLNTRSPPRRSLNNWSYPPTNRPTLSEGESVFSLLVDLAAVPFTGAGARVCFPPGSDSLHRPPKARERERRFARQRSEASSPDRTASAHRGPHLLDQPEAPPCGATRKPERLPRPRRGREIVTAFTCPTNAVSPCVGSH